MFYTYLWLREDGTPYYVGKGQGDRAFVKDSHRHYPPKDRERILIQEFPDEASAYEAERFLISYFGRVDLGTGCLRNLTDGGENPPKHTGRKQSPETVAKRAAKLRGKRRTGTALANIQKATRAVCSGRKMSEQTRSKMRQSRLKWFNGLTDAQREAYNRSATQNVKVAWTSKSSLYRNTKGQFAGVLNG
jgi:hypothetical protein